MNAARPTADKPDPKALKAAVDAAVLASRTPPEPGMTSWPFTVPQQHFSPGDWKLLWDVVRYVRARHNALFREFLYSQTIADLIVDYLAELKTAPTLQKIVRQLRNEAAKSRAWLVEVPLHHLKLPREIVPVAKPALLVASDQRRDRVRTGPHLKHMFDVYRYFGVDMSVSGRWQHTFGGREDIIDRRIFSSFVIAEDGTEEVAVALAQTRATRAGPLVPSHPSAIHPEPDSACVACDRRVVASAFPTVRNASEAVRLKRRYSVAWDH